MTIPNILRFIDIQPQSSEHYPDPNLRVKGVPKRTTSTYFANESNGLKSGLWKSEVGSYGFDKRLNLKRRETLEMVVNDLFPGAGETAKATFWTGLRPMTPDGTPIVGATRLSNLFLNTGHGTLGWTMSCGSGKLLADLISGRIPAIPADDLSVARYATHVDRLHQPAYV